MKMNQRRKATAVVASSLITSILILWTISATRPHNPRVSLASSTSDEAAEIRSRLDNPESDHVPTQTVADRGGYSLDTPCGALATNELCFADGTILGIEWRRSPAVAGSPPDPPFAQHYDSLFARAQNGDASAAFSIYEMLSQCEKAHESEDQLAAALELLHQTHQLQTSDMAGPERIASPEKIPVFESILMEDYRNCIGLTRTQKANRDTWLEAAAAGNLPIAKLRLGLMQDDHRVALSHFEQAWAMGEIEALPLMASVYRHQYNVGEEQTFNIRAYATYLAYTRLLEAAMGPGTGHGHIAARQIERVREGLADRAGELQQYEERQAIQMAIELIESNGTCCFGL